MQKLKLISALLVVALSATAHAQDKDKDKEGGKQNVSKTRRTANEAVANKDWSTAIAQFKQLVEADPKDSNAWLMLGYSLHSNNDLDEALKAHIKATEFHDVAPIASYNAACVFALKQKKEEALNWLTKAVNAGFSDTNTIASDTDMDAIRGEPRFKELAAQIEKNAVNPPTQVYAVQGARQMTRMVMFAGRGSIGGASISYGQPQWKADYEKQIESPKLQNQRWRLGKDEWTTLDTSVGMKLGEQQLSAGIYYLTVARRGSDFVLAALDPTSVHKHTIDPYLAHLTTGGTEVVLKHETSDSVAEELEIELVQTVGTQGAGNLVIRFGPHKLSAPFALLAKGQDGSAK